MKGIAVFSGTAHPELAAEICRHLGVPLSPSRLTRFANDCLEVQLQANCRERDVYIIQPLVTPVQEHLIELLLMLDAARGASASRITVVMPFYAYARSDKKDAPRISIGGRLVADLMVTAGASRVLAMTLHSPQVHGFFSIPVDHLHALNEIAGHFKQYDLSNTVAVSPDLGNAKETASFARLLGVGVAVAAKQRFADDKVRISSIIGDVMDKDVIVLDDEIARQHYVRTAQSPARTKGPLHPHRLHAWAVRRRVGRAAERAARRAGDRLHQFRADRGGEAGVKADRAIDRRAAGRSHSAYP
jgi:ribose-phosphate pyrophosphokinase